jgi:hypothetical protein
VIRRIKELLYEEGYTIAGAKKRLQSELEEGRSYAAPEVDGELFIPEGDGGDDVPGIAVDDGEAVESGEPAELPAAAQLAARESLSEAARATPPVESAPPPASAPVDVGESPVRSSSPRRSRGKAAPKVEAAMVEATAGEVAAAPAAVDSALSERVETLEHGLRRVLAEVRNLRELLADPSGDR